MQSQSERELSKHTRKKTENKLVDNPITRSQLEWELVAHAEGYSAERNPLVLMLKVRTKIVADSSFEWVVYVSLSLPN